ncbi:MAG TPA: methyltransferase [Cyclobacteriaceae bacterium]|nr:methyltransferase [Cyclobacteriaceae bacterium]
MNRVLQRILLPLPSIVRWYLSKKRIYKSRGLRIIVLPGVFHPGFFFSTEMMLQYLSQQSFRGKSVLEVGAGTGIISLFIAKQGGDVTATDISERAIENIRLNASENNLPLTVVRSNLFDHIDGKYEWIVVNPPYYARNPLTEAEYAWHCGENHEYFRTFFSGLAAHMSAGCRAVMVLSDVCDLKTIFQIASENNFKLETQQEKNVWADGRNYIFSIKSAI